MISQLSFLTPWALAALILLPAIWWLLRFTPPKPDRVHFAPFRLLLELANKEQQPDHTPWWLILLRMIFAALLIFAIARPVINPEGENRFSSAPILLVIDDGWAAAADWPARYAALQRVLDDAARSESPIAIATTASPAGQQNIELQNPAIARKNLATILPHPVLGNRQLLWQQLQPIFSSTTSLQVVWFSDGLDTDGGTMNAAEFARNLQSLGNGSGKLYVTLPEPTDLPLALTSPTIVGSSINLKLLRADNSTNKPVTLRYIARNGRVLSSQQVQFANNENHAEADLELPIALRNEIQRIDIADSRTAAAVQLLDDRFQRKLIALLSRTGNADNQPLLSPVYYIDRALAPYAQLDNHQNARISEILKSGVSMMVLADIGTVPDSEHDALMRWVKNGGLLVRFAGPRMAAGHDDLVPVTLRQGDRALGSALSWDKPQAMLPFDNQSPFSGLAIDPTVKIHRQVLAEPTPDLSRKTWASLQDGTPLITAARNGKGMIVLFHVTASPDWSNLPLSGLFVEMLKRVLDLAPATPPANAKADIGSVAANNQTTDINGAWVPQSILNGFGELKAPDATTKPIPGLKIDNVIASNAHPPGLYKRQQTSRAINLDLQASNLQPIGQLPSAVIKTGFAAAAALALAPMLFAAAMLAFIADCLAVLFLAGGRFNPFGKSASATATAIAITLAGAVLLTSNDSHAENFDAGILAAAKETTLAYVITGDRAVDDISRAGLTGLNLIIRKRTSIETSQVQAVDIERDDISLYPLLYWPVIATAKPPSPEARGKLVQFMKTGGTIFLDTRDDKTGVAALTGASTPASAALAKLLEGLDVPPLQPVPPEHVLTKSFYLLQSFPGRWASGNLWVEADGRNNGDGAVADGVSSLIIGSNDYAAAWAIDNNNRFMLPVSPGFNRQREFAYRTGVNIVMYALTGNYKADQVHVPALLERLGQ